MKHLQKVHGNMYYKRNMQGFLTYFCFPPPPISLISQVSNGPSYGMLVLQVEANPPHQAHHTKVLPAHYTKELPKNKINIF